MLARKPACPEAKDASATELYMPNRLGLHGEIG
jgi:hypothetical protein